MVLLNRRKTISAPDMLKCLHCECTTVPNPWPNTVIERVECQKCGEWNRIEWVEQDRKLAANLVYTDKVPAN